MTISHASVDETIMWWDVEGPDVGEAVCARGVQIRSDNSPRYEKWERAFELVGERYEGSETEELTVTATENIVAEAVESRAAELTQAGIRVVIQATALDFEQKLKAEHSEWYADAAYFKHRLPLLHYVVVKDAIIGGIGISVVSTASGRPVPERVHPCDSLFEDHSPTESPEFGRKLRISKHKLAQDYPEHKEAILALEARDGKGRHRVEVYEFWYDAGTDADGKPRDGRHVAAIHGLPEPLFDEVWQGRAPWSYVRAEPSTQRLTGPSMVLRAEGLQAEHDRESMFLQDSANKRVPRELFDANKIQADQLENQAGTAVAVNGDVNGAYLPTTPAAVHPEKYQRLEGIRQAIFRMIGANEMFSSGELPAGIRSGSGKAIKHYRENRSKRHKPSELERDFYSVSNVTELLRGEARLQESDGRKVTVYVSGIYKQIDWADLLWDPDDIQMQASPSSDLPLDPAVRIDMLAELVKDEIIERQDFYANAAVVDFKDVERRATAKIRLCELYISQMLRDRKPRQPPKYVPTAKWLDLSLDRLMLAELDGAPEEVLKPLRAWTDELADRLKPAEPPPPPPDAMGPLPMPPDMVPPGAPPIPGDPGGMPPLPPPPGGPPPIVN